MDSDSHTCFVVRPKLEHFEFSTCCGGCLDGNLLHTFCGSLLVGLLWSVIL